MIVTPIIKRRFFGRSLCTVHDDLRLVSLILSMFMDEAALHAITWKWRRGLKFYYFTLPESKRPTLRSVNFGAFQQSCNILRGLCFISLRFGLRRNLCKSGIIRFVTIYGFASWGSFKILVTGLPQFTPIIYFVIFILFYIAGRPALLG